MNLFKRSNQKVDYYQPESKPEKPSLVAKTNTITWLWLFILMLIGATVIFFILWYRFQRPIPLTRPKKVTPANTVMTVSPTLPLSNNTSAPASLLQNITLTNTNSETIVDFHFNGKVIYKIQRQPAANRLTLIFDNVRLTQPINLNKLNSRLVTSINSLVKNNAVQVVINIKPNTDIEHVAYLKAHNTLQMILYRKGSP